MAGPTAAASDAFLNRIGGAITDYSGTIGDLVDYVTGNEAPAIATYDNSAACWYGPTCLALTTSIPILIGTTSDYNKITAQADANQLVNSIFLDYREEALPQIYQAQNGVSAWNSTTAQLLVNDAYAKTVSKAAGVVLDNIGKYGQIRTADIGAIAQLASATKQSKSSPSGGGGGGGGGDGGLFGGIAGIVGGLFGL